jgi:hypothetical protein
MTGVFKLKTSLQALAAECLDVFGEGARREDCGELYWFMLNSSDVSNGYVRIPMKEHIAVGLDYVVNTLGYISPNADLIKIEYFGQDIVQTGEDEDGNPVYGEQLFQTGTQDVVDEQGNVIATNNVYLGRIN